jgi:hypothetical protein
MFFRRSFSLRLFRAIDGLAATRPRTCRGAFADQGGFGLADIVSSALFGCGLRGPLASVSLRFTSSWGTTGS